MVELIAITQKALQSQSWKMKAQGAAAMASIAQQQTGSLVAPHLGMVLSALMHGLGGRTWAGKVRPGHAAPCRMVKLASQWLFTGFSHYIQGWT